MSELRSDDGILEPHRSSVDRDPTQPGWFTHQAALALMTRFTTVHGYSDLLARVVAREPLDLTRLTSYTQTLGQQVDDLGRFLAQYLQAVQLQAGLITLHPRPVGLTELLEPIQQACTAWPECTERHTLRVDQTDAITGAWDPHWVGTALAAIVSNAMKFTPDGGTIQVEIQRQADAAVVTVRDPGLGIREDEREQIFHPFVRGSTVQGITSGWGLGLYIADQAVRAHGGAIDFTSAPSVGTTVTIRLPLQAVLDA